MTEVSEIAAFVHRHFASGLSCLIDMLSALER